MWRNHHALFSYVSRPCRDGSPVFYYSAECLKQKAITNGLHSLFEKRKMMQNTLLQKRILCIIRPIRVSGILVKWGRGGLCPFSCIG